MYWIKKYVLFLVVAAMTVSLLNVLTARDDKPLTEPGQIIDDYFRYNMNLETEFFDKIEPLNNCPAAHVSSDFSDEYPLGDRINFYLRGKCKGFVLCAVKPQATPLWFCYSLRTDDGRINLAVCDQNDKVLAVLYPGADDARYLIPPARETPSISEYRIICLGEPNATSHIIYRFVQSASGK